MADLNRVDLVVTDRWFEDTADVFNKAKGLNEGAKRLTRKGWVVVLDADVILPHSFYFILEALPPVPGKLYWMKRCIVSDRAQYTRIKNGYEKTPPVDYHIAASGYCHIMYGSDSALDTVFDESNRTAARVDLNFRDRWLKQDWVELPHTCLHLGPRQTNWSGRVSLPW